MPVRVHVDNNKSGKKSLTQQLMVFSLANEGRYFSFCADDPHIAILDRQQITILINKMHFYNTLESSNINNKQTWKIGILDCTNSEHC